MNIRGIIAIIMSLALLKATTVDANPDNITVYTEILYPISYQDETTKEFRGYATEVLRDAFQDAGIDYTIKYHSWARSYDTVLTTPNTLLYSVARIPEREDQFIWLQKITSLNYGLYTTNPQDVEMSLEDARKAYITVTQGGVSHKTLLKHGFENFIFIDDYSRISQLVGRDRISIIFTTSFWYKYNKDQFSKPLYLLENIDLSVSDVGLYFVMNKNSDADTVEKMKDSFNKVLAGAEEVSMQSGK